MKQSYFSVALEPVRARRFVLAALATVATAAALTLVPIGRASAHPGPGGWEGGIEGLPFAGGPAHGDSKVADARLDGILEIRLAPANATKEQRDKIAAILKAARADIAPTERKLFESRREFAKLFAAPTIDRAAIEQARAQQAQLHELVARRRLQALEDAAEVLTPEQRAKLAAAHEHHGHKDHHQPPQPTK